MPRLQKSAGGCGCADPRACNYCTPYAAPSPLVYGTNTTGAVPFTVTGTTIVTGSSCRPCGLSWLYQCQCYVCSPQLTFKFVEQPPTFEYTKQVLPKHEEVLEEIKNSTRIN